MAFKKRTKLNNNAVDSGLIVKAGVCAGRGYGLHPAILNAVVERKNMLNEAGVYNSNNPYADL